MKTAEDMLARMEALLRHMVSRYPEPETGIVGKDIQSHYKEARAIVAELPAPVDSDLLEVRKAVGEAVPTMMQGDKNILNGDFDNDRSIKVPLAMLKLGRQLEREGK